MIWILAINCWSTLYILDIIPCLVRSWQRYFPSFCRLALHFGDFFLCYVKVHFRPFVSSFVCLSVSLDRVSQYSPGTCNVDHAGLKPTEILCLCFPSAGIKGMCNHTWLVPFVNSLHFFPVLLVSWSESLCAYIFFHFFKNIIWL